MTPLFSYLATPNDCKNEAGSQIMKKLVQAVIRQTCGHAKFWFELIKKVLMNYVALF